MARLLAATLLLLAATCGGQQNGTAVMTSFGPILGDMSPYAQKSSPIFRFRGIPYAAPPTGSLRWAAPVPPAPWATPRNASAYGSRCSQNEGAQSTVSFDVDDSVDIPASEDCLYLNVWTPCANATCNLPVLVWIHGGFLTIGHAGDPFYEGTGLAAQGAVVISINYRLDAMGFLDTGVPGAANFGFQDQQLALKWVQANAGAFGGDAARVTLFGESAGAWSVSAQLMMPASVGLFRRAILQSGALAFWPNAVTALPFLSTQREALSSTEALLRALNCTDVACARSRPAAAVMAAAALISAPSPQYPLGRAFAAVRDGTVLPADTVSALHSGAFSKVDLIAGYTTNEGSAVVTNPLVYNSEFFGALVKFLYGGGCGGAGIISLYSPGGSRYPGAQSDYLTLLPAQLKAYQAWARDFMFKCPIRQLLQGAARNRPPPAPAGAPKLYLFEFALSPSIGPPATHNLGATHGADLAYVFGTGIPFFRNADEAGLARLMMASWVNFAATGSPGAFWPEYDLANESMVVFGPGAGLTVTVPPGRNAVATTFPKSGCMYLEPYPPTPPCVESSPPNWTATIALPFLASVGDNVTAVRSGAAAFPLSGTAAAIIVSLAIMLVWL